MTEFESDQIKKLDSISRSLDSISEHLRSIDNSLYLLSLLKCLSKSDDLDIGVPPETGAPVFQGTALYRNALRLKIQNAVKVVLGPES